MTRGQWLLLIGVLVVAFLALRSWLASPPPGNPNVTQVTMRGHDNTQQPRKWKAYACAQQLAPVYVKLDAHVRKFGSDFSLTNQPDPDKNFVQDAAVLNVRLSGSTAVEAIIVLAKAPLNGADTDYAGHENDKLAPVQHVSPGKSLHYTLHTDQYVREQPKGDIINAVTLCLTRPHHTPNGNSAQGAPVLWSSCRSAGMCMVLRVAVLPQPVPGPGPQLSCFMHAPGRGLLKPAGCGGASRADLECGPGQRRASRSDVESCGGTA